MPGHQLFETPLGLCGIAWGASGVLAIQLPEPTPEAVRARLFLRSGDLPEAAPPRAIREAIQKVKRHLEGEAQDFAKVELDTTGLAPFHARVYEAARAIPSGRTRTYGELARALGSPGAARAVGQALAKNPFPVIVPCHRVLASGGRAGGFSAHGGRATKARILALEGVALEVGKGPEAKGSLFRGAGALPFDWDEAVRHLGSADPVFGRLVQRVRESRGGESRLELKELSSPFASLLEAIVHQQLGGAAARTIHGRVVALFAPKKQPAPADILGASDEALRGCGLSRAKVAAAKDLAARTLDGTVPSLAQLRKLDDEAIVERLTQIRGIGRWTVEMLLIFRLGRPDVLSTADYGVRKGHALAYALDDLATPRQLGLAGEAWRPYRTVASWFFWRALELPVDPSRKVLHP